MIFYVLECSVEKCVAEFYINDIPITRRGPQYGKMLNGPMNQMIKDGVNALEIVVNPGDIPSESYLGSGGKRRRLTPEDGAFAKAKISKYPKGAVVGGPDEEELMAVEWAAEKDRIEMFPKVVSAAADLGQIFGPWQWEGGSRIALEEETLKEIFDFVLEIHGYLVVADFEPFIEFSLPRSSDTDLAYGKTPGQSAEEVRIEMERCTNNSWWSMKPLKPDDFDFRLCGCDKMIECISKEWKPVIEEEPDEEGSISRYPMMIGKIDGKWRIVR